MSRKTMNVAILILAVVALLMMAVLNPASSNAQDIPAPVSTAAARAREAVDDMRNNGDLDEFRSQANDWTESQLSPAMAEQWRTLNATPVPRRRGQRLGRCVTRRYGPGRCGAMLGTGR